MVVAVATTAGLQISTTDRAVALRSRGGSVRILRVTMRVWMTGLTGGTGGGR